MKKKLFIGIVIIITVVELLFAVWRFFGLFILIMIDNEKAPTKNDIVEFVNYKSEELQIAVAEIEELKKGYGTGGLDAHIDGIGHTDIEDCADGIKGLYISIDDPLGEDTYKEIDSDVLSDIITGNPVRYIYISDDIITFDCGGIGIAPSCSDYMFYYSEANEPVAVYYGGEHVCQTWQMHPHKDGYRFIDSGGNTFYTEKIKGNFFWSEAHF